MGTLNDIRQKLISGYTVSQLIGEGFAKSSINHVARKLKDTQPGTPASPVSDEILELRRHKEIIKLQKEIADLEAVKEKLPERVAALEKAVLDLRSLVNNAVDTALFQSLVYAGMGRGEAWELANNWVDRNIKG